MNISAASMQKPKVGSCPHGLPMGACPICSGAGGGGSSRRAAKPGEMSWDECVAMGNILKAQRLAKQQAKLEMQEQAAANLAAKLDNIAAKMANLIQKLTDFSDEIQSQTNPNLISKTLAFAAKIATPLLNILKDIPLVIQKTATFVQQKLADISDKLNAIFGELKNSVEKKISDRLKDFKKKFKSLFGILESAEVEDEEKRIEEAKRSFELKTVTDFIKEKLANNSDANEINQI